MEHFVKRDVEDVWCDNGFDTSNRLVSDIAVFVLKRVVKLQPTIQPATETSSALSCWLGVFSRHNNKKWRLQKEESHWKGHAGLQSCVQEAGSENTSQVPSSSHSVLATWLLLLRQWRSICCQLVLTPILCRKLFVMRSCRSFLILCTHLLRVN